MRQARKARKEGRLDRGMRVLPLLLIGLLILLYFVFR
jgi:hypothetical protein